MNQEAFEAGKKMRDAILAKNGNLESVAYKIKEAGKRGVNDFCDAYLLACVDFGVTPGSFPDQVLTGENSASEIGLSIALGIKS